MALTAEEQATGEKYPEIVWLLDTIAEQRETITQLQEDNFDLNDAYLGLVDEVQILRMSSATAGESPSLKELLEPGEEPDRVQFFDTLGEESKPK